MSDLVLTRAEVERRLEKGLLQRNVSFTKVNNEIVTGIIQKVSVWEFGGELIVTFQIYSKKYEADLIYLSENLVIHYGSTHRGECPDVWRILQAD